MPLAFRNATVIKDAESIAEDSILIYECQHGQPEAFRKLVDKYKDYLFDLCYRITGNRLDAEDITQETFIKFYNQMNKYNPAYKLSNWLYTIALNDCRKKLRHDRILKFFSIDPTGGAGSEEPLIELADPGPAPDEQLKKKEAGILAQKMVLSLPNQLRVPFFMRYMKEMELAEIAQVTGLTLNHVKVKIHRAKEYLMKKYGENIAQV